MNTQLFLFRELLGAIRTRSALFFVLSGVLLFLFLTCVASFFMIAPSLENTSTDGQPIEELRVFLSPRLSSSTIDQWFLDWRERDDVAGIRFQFAQEYDKTDSGGVFIVSPADPALASELASEFRSIDGVTEVVEIPREPIIETSSMFLVIRIVLLVILVLAIAASLFCFRRGYRELLRGFSGEVRMLRLSGISERILGALIVALGGLLGLLVGLFLLAALFLFHQIALSHPAAFSQFGGLTSGIRVLSVGMATLVLGVVLGALAGLLGASLLHGREFDALP